MEAPKVNPGCKASPVRVTRADGSVVMQAAYDRDQMRVALGVGKDKAPGRPRPNRFYRKNGQLYKNGKKWRAPK